MGGSFNFKKLEPETDGLFVQTIVESLSLPEQVSLSLVCGSAIHDDKPELVGREIASKFQALSDSWFCALTHNIELMPIYKEATSLVCLLEGKRSYAAKEAVLAVIAYYRAGNSEKSAKVFAREVTISAIRAVMEIQREGISLAAFEDLYNAATAQKEVKNGTKKAGPEPA